LLILRSANSPIHDKLLLILPRNFDGLIASQDMSGNNRGGLFASSLPVFFLTKEIEMATQVRDSAKAARVAPADGFSPEEVKNLSSVLNALVADVFALYLKTKNFHWHMNGPHFRDYHLLLDEQASQIFAISDDVAERVRKIGGTTIHSIGQISRLQRIQDNDQEFVEATAMLKELHADNRALVESLRAAHVVASNSNDYATTSLIENWIDEAERRAWFLFEATR
jgi:starvation-inducible DNA-binding protein